MRHVDAFAKGGRRRLTASALVIALSMTCSCGKRAEPPAAEPPPKMTKQPPAPPLWKPVQLTGPYTPTPQAIRSQGVEIDVQQLLAPANNRLALSLPDGNEITALRSELRALGKNRFIWRGTIEGDAAGVVKFSVVDDVVVGDIVTSVGKMYRVRFVEKRINVVEQLAPGKFPQEAEPLERPIRAGGPGESRLLRSAPSDQNAIIDVLVLYTNAAQAYANANQAMTATIDEAIDDANQSYVDSKVRQEIKLVGSQLIAYKEKNGIQLDLQALKDEGDGDLDGAHQLRKASGADIVVLLTKPVEQNETCGKAYQMETLSTAECAYAFAVVPVSCATGRYSFAHELGHVMGAQHAGPKGNGTPPFTYNRGYETPSKAWHTIMANPTVNCVGEACPPRIRRWSNPDPAVNFSLGTSPPLPTGLPDAADNALTLNTTASVVANFFPSPECGQISAAPGRRAPKPPEDVSAQ